MIAFPLEPIKILASAFGGVITADCGTVFVDCAAALSRVQKLACGIVDRVLPMAKNAAVTLNNFGEALFGHFVAYFETGGEPLDVTSRNDDVVVRAAIPGTLGTIIEDWKGSVCHMTDSAYLSQIADKLQPQ